MTRRAARQNRGVPNAVFLHQCSAEHGLIATRLPTHVENLVTRTQELLRFTMAAEAPFHLQRRGLPHERHLVHPAVAGGTPNSFSQVNAVVEIGEIREIVNPRPADRRTALKTIAHRLQHLARGPDLRMAVHAYGRRRNARERREFHRGVAVTTIDTESANMMLMTEGHRLGARDVLLCDV